MKKILGIIVICLAMMSFVPVYALNRSLMKQNNPSYGDVDKPQQPKIKHGRKIYSNSSEIREEQKERRQYNKSLQRV